MNSLHMPRLCPTLDFPDLKQCLHHLKSEDSINQAIRSNISICFKPLIVETDDSSYAVGAILTQKDDECRSKPVQQPGRTMNVAERNYTVSEKETLGFFCPYKIQALHAISRSYHSHYRPSSPPFCVGEKDVHRRLVRCLNLVAEYKYEILYRTGNSTPPADYISSQRRNDRETSEMLLSVENCHRQNDEEKPCSIFKKTPR